MSNETPVKIETIVIDTLTAFQKRDMFLKQDKGRLQLQDWADYGNDLCLFINNKLVQDYGFEVVGIFGYEGTGKSFGMKTLPTKTNLWFNGDYKNPTWKGGREEYGTINKPTHMMRLVKSYEEICAIIENGLKKGAFSENRIAFITGHLEQFKGSNDKIRERLKTLGKVSSKMNIEDKLTNCFYTEVTQEAGEPVYTLDTRNNGANTARSLEGLFEERYIPNDFNLIAEAIRNYK